MNFYGENLTKKDLEKISISWVKKLSVKIQLLSYIFISFELNKNNKWHAHCMIGVRSLVGFNPFIFNNIKNLIRDEIIIDSLVKELKTEIDIKKAFHYCAKNANNELNYTFITAIENWFDMIAELYDYYINWCHDSGTIKIEQSKLFDNIIGWTVKENDFSKEILIHLWNYYIILNRLYIYNDKLYYKLENYEISYKFFNNIDVLFTEFSKIIIPFFLNNFPIQFENFDFYNLITKFIINKKNLIETLLLIVTNKINPDFSLLEFTDGLYSIKLNKFIPKKELKKFNLNNKISTLKYYNKTYKHIQEPVEWKKNMIETLEGNLENFHKICLFIANIFHKNDNIFKKKRVLSIIGESNTQKTTLVVKPLTNFFGKENVGVITKGSNFNFENLINKMIFIIDEYSHNKQIESEILKLFEGEDIIINKKFSEPILLKNQPTIIVSNYEIKTKKKETQEAIENRIIPFIFTKKLKPNEADNYINNKLKNEEASMIIYCNNIYFKEEYKNKKTRINYEKSINYILYENFKIKENKENNKNLIILN